jgi:hypothetical protein
MKKIFLIINNNNSESLDLKEKRYVLGAMRLGLEIFDAVE